MFFGRAYGDRTACFRVVPAVLLLDESSISWKGGQDFNLHARRLCRAATVRASPQRYSRVHRSELKVSKLLLTGLSACQPYGRKERNSHKVELTMHTKTAYNLYLTDKPWGVN